MVVLAEHALQAHVLSQVEQLFAEGSEVVWVLFVLRELSQVFNEIIMARIAEGHHSLIYQRLL